MACWGGRAQGWRRQRDQVTGGRHVRSVVELDRFAFAGGAQTALAMCGRTAFPGRTDAGLTQQTTQGLAAEREALDLTKFFAEMVIVEAGIGSACQSHDPLAHGVGQATVAGSAAAGVLAAKAKNKNEKS